MIYKTLILITAFTAGLLYTSNKKVDVIKWEELEKIINVDNDTTYIINFWATWCKPCVKELPYFEQINAETKGQKVKVVLVSLDMIEILDTKLADFLQKKQIQSKVVLLDEVDGNKFIDKVDSSWSGAIPATLIFNNKKEYRYFHEGEMTYEQLKEKLNI